jgi:hypothetical protein
MIFPPTTLQESWIPRYSGICENEIADELTREGTVHQFVGPEPVLRVSKQNIKKKITRWLGNQNVTMWQGLTCTHRQAQELISDPRLAAKTRLLSFNMMQSCIITVLLTGHNTLTRQCYMRLIYNPLCEKCGVDGETTALVLWECKTLATYISGVLFLGPRKC